MRHFFSVKLNIVGCLLFVVHCAAGVEKDVTTEDYESYFVNQGTNLTDEDSDDLETAVLMNISSQAVEVSRYAFSLLSCATSPPI